MTIKEVCMQFNITADTLRYYERVGVIPEVHRSPSGNRDYDEEDLDWVENAICMREAGVPVEMLIEYVKLYQQGESTFTIRRDLLKEVKEKILEEKRKYDFALERLDYKIGKYEDAIQTGQLIWDD